MENQNRQPNGNLDFEENLRHILTPGPASVNAGASGSSDNSAGRGTAANDAARPARKFIERANRIEEEQKKLFWFKLLRPLAFLALVALLAGFVYRITTFGAP